MDITEALRIVAAARKDGRVPDLHYANLSGAHLERVDLREVVLYGANLSGANLSEANLRGANLAGANLVGAELWHANLRSANLLGAGLIGANLRVANLSNTELRNANLQNADLRWAYGDNILVLNVNGLPSGTANLYPTPEGWRLTVGCWQGTVDGLSEMIAQDEGWPEARDEEIAQRRPGLELLAALCHDHIARHPDTIANLAARWEA